MNRTLRLGIGGAALIVIVIFAWFVILGPIRQDTSATESSIKDAQTELSQYRTQLAQAESTRAEGMRNQEKLISLSKMVPQGNEMESLLVQVQDLAAQAGIDFISITPSAAQVQGTFSIVPLSADFTGTFFDISDFVYRAEQMVAGPGRLLAISSLDLQLGDSTTASTGTSSASSTPVLKASMVIYAFDYETDTAKVKASTSSASSSDSTTTTSTSK